MKTAINEACIVEGDFSGARNGTFFATGRYSCPIYRVFSKWQVWENRHGSPNILGTRGKMKRGVTFLVGWVIQEVQIRDMNLLDSFVLRELIPMSFCKKVMKLRICTTGKTFGKICLQTNKNTFSQHVFCNQRRDKVRRDI